MTLAPIGVAASGLILRMNSGLKILAALSMLALLGTAQADPPGVTGMPIDRNAIKPALPPGPLILPLEVDMAAAQTFIRIGFGLDDTVHFQSTDMLTPVMRTVQAQQLIRMVESYNNFDGKKVADALGQFRGVVSGIQFGREGSPVIYIDLPYWTHQQEEVAVNQMGQRISDKEFARVVKTIHDVMVNDLAADEFSVEHRRVRIWWD